MTWLVCFGSLVGWLCKEYPSKRSRPRFAAAARFPALLDWSGGCGTRATRSDSPRRNLL